MYVQSWYVELVFAKTIRISFWTEKYLEHLGSCDNSAQNKEIKGGI